MATPPQKVSLYSTNDLKNATDDAIAPYLTTLPKPYTFTQVHTLTNVRLLLGYSAVLIAGVLFYFDYKFGWDATKPYTLPACVAYFVLNGAYTYWIWAVEKQTVFVGVREGGQKLTLKSSSPKYSSSYKLKITYEAPSGKKWEQDKLVEGRFSEWFSVQGFLQQKEFKRWLARNVEVVGLADPSVLGSTKTGETKYEEIVDDVVTTAAVEGRSGKTIAGTGMDTTPSSAVKRTGAGGTATPGTGRPKKKI